MNCPDSEQLVAFLDDRLPLADQDSVALHATNCGACQTRLDELAAIPIAAAAGGEANWDGDVADRISRRVWATMSSGGNGAASVQPEVPGCEVRGIIGRGGMGTVYLAWQQRLERLVAIKVLPAQTAADASARARFLREVAAVGKLNHPGIVTAFDANEHGGVHYLLMEYVAGENLSKVVRRRTRLNVADACEVIRQAAVALQYAHEHGLIHRDVKPSNVMLTPDGVVKVLDLGLARIDSVDRADLTSTGQVMGTIEYMAPEQGDVGRDVDVRSDVFSLGATLFKLLTGKAPLETIGAASPMRKLTALALGKLPSIAELRGDLPKDLIACVDRMLAHDPATRFPDPAHVASAVEPFCAGHDLRRLVETDAAPPTVHPGVDTLRVGHQQVSTEDVGQHSRVTAPYESRAKRGWPVRSLAFAATLLTLFAAAVVFRLATDGGEIQVTSFDPNVEIEVLRNDRAVDAFEVGRLADYTWYRSGKYEIRIKGNSDAINVKDGQFQLNRGDKRLVTIERVGKTIAAQRADILNPDQKLRFGSLLRSANEEYSLTLNKNGRLEIVDWKDRVVWSSPSLDKEAKGPPFLELKSDGNIVVRSRNETIWESASGRDLNDAGCYAQLLDSGRLVVYSRKQGEEEEAHTLLWYSTRSYNQSMSAETTLRPGDSLWCPTCRLRLQPDGDLTIIEYDGDRVVWSSGPQDVGPAVYAKLLRNGNLVVDAGDGRGVVWESGAHAIDDCSLLISEHGHLRIYAGEPGKRSIVWRSTRENSLYSHTKFRPGSQLTSPNGLYKLSLQPGGNLQIRGRAENAVWESGASATGDCYAQVQSSGKLVVQNEDDQSVVWESDGVESLESLAVGDGCYAWLDDDGYLSVFEYGGKRLLWTNRPDFRSRLYRDIELFRGQTRTSPNGEYTLSMEESGRLVIRSRDGREIWATPPSDGDFAVVQPAGNLVIYSGGRFVPGSKQKAFWATNIARHAAGTSCCAKLLDSGSLAVLSGPGRPSFAGPEDEAIIIWQSPPDPQR